MIILEIFVSFLVSYMIDTPTSWYEVTRDGHFVLACGDEDGTEIPCTSALTSEGE